MKVLRSINRVRALHQLSYNQNGKRLAQNIHRRILQRRKFCDYKKQTGVRQTQQNEGSSAVSTFVYVKEKTEEGLSFVYVMGMLCVIFPGCVYVVLKSLFSTSGADNVRNTSYQMIQEHAQCRYILGEDMFAQQTSHSQEYTDDQGNKKMTVIYQVKGNKTDARVDAEMKLVDNEWEWEFVIVSAPYGVIYVVDNRMQHTY